MIRVSSRGSVRNQVRASTNWRLSRCVQLPIMLVESGSPPRADTRTDVTSWSALARKSMTERDWELYRLSVVEQLPEGAYKDALIAGIKFKLSLLDQLEAAGCEVIRRATVA
jgi:hypothetical protein